MEIADDQEDQLPEVNFVPCLKFIKRNVASSKNIADVSECTCVFEILKFNCLF